MCLQTVLLLLVLLSSDVNLFPVSDETVSDQEWDPFKTTKAKPDGQTSSTKPPCTFLRLPEYQQILASDVQKDLFKPETGIKPLPYVLKSILLPPPTRKPTVQASQTKTIEILCHLDRIYVKVLKRLFTSLEAWKYLKVGTCGVNQMNSDSYFFLYSLNNCGVKRQENQDRVTFSNTLTYEPVSAGIFARDLPFSVNLECHYNKHHRSYSIGFRPEIEEGTVFISLNSKVSLIAVDETWKPLASWQSFVAGQPMHFIAKAPKSPKGKRLYLNKCYITTSQDPESTPKYTVLDNYGCMVDGKNTPQSTFFSSDCKTIVRFAVGAILSKDMIEPGTKKSMFIHCEMTLGPEEATPSAKSCSYAATTKQWTELYNEDHVCACCNASCPAPQSPDVKMLSSKAWEAEYESEHDNPMRSKTDKDLYQKDLYTFWD